MQQESKKLNVVLTGGNSGIGYQTVRALCNMGHNVIFGSRNVQRNQECVKKIKQEVKEKGYVNSYPLDLAKKKSIQQFAQSVKKQFPNHVDILINNSGLLRPELELSELNIEMTLTVNHFGHFYLTYLLFEQIKQSKEARIVNVSSTGHYSLKKKDNFYDDLQGKNSKYDYYQQYFLSKLANIHFTQALASKMAKYPHIKTVSLHPGIIITRIGDDTLLGGGKFLKFLKKIASFFTTSQEQGAETTLYTCVVQFDKLKSGEYYSDKAYKEMDPKGRITQEAQKLWKISQKAYEIEFNV